MLTYIDSKLNLNKNNRKYPVIFILCAQERWLSESASLYKGQKNCTEDEKQFSQETIDAVMMLGNILWNIYNRLISESYFITKKKIIDPKGIEVYPNDRRPNKKERNSKKAELVICDKT